MCCTKKNKYFGTRLKSNQKILHKHLPYKTLQLQNFIYSTNTILNKHSNKKYHHNHFPIYVNASLPKLY